MIRNSQISQRFALLAGFALLTLIAGPSPKRSEAADAKPAKKDSREAARPKEATFTTTITPAEAKPGDTVTYKVTAKIDAPWHIYKYSKTPKNDGPKYTEFDFFEPAGLKVDGDWSPSVAPTKKKEPAFPDIPFLEYHEEEVTWSVKLKIPSDATAGKKTLKCQIGYMICSDQNCSFPGQWTLPDAEVTISTAPKFLKLRDEASAGILLAVVPQAPQVEAPKPKKKDSRAAARPKDTNFKTEISPAEAKPGDTVTLKVTATVDPGAHIYKYSTVQPDDGPKLTNFDLFDPAGLITKGEWTPDRPPIKKKEPAFPTIDFLEFYEGEVTWSLPLEVPKDAEPGKKSIQVQITFMTCTDQNCSFPGQWTLPAHEITILPGAVAAPKAAAVPVAKLAEPTSKGSGDVNSKLQEGIIPFLIFCAGGGLFALAMPCVWPMIPVTVNFFVKQGQKKQGSTTGLAIGYCLSIILTFMGIGFLFSIFFGAASLSKLANNPWLNFGIAGLFLVFGLSLLGLFEIRLPNFLLNASSHGESKGGMVGVMFMALTLTITSFTCTFPVVGGLLVMAAGGSYFYPVIGLATFAGVLAFPFLLLALSPGLLSKMPKSGDWMNTVKVVGGLIEIGAAFKFINTAECIFVVPSEAWFNAYTVLTIWVVMALICGIYLLGLFRTDHDYEEVKVGPGRMIFGWAFLALALFLAPALFGRPPENKIWFLVAGLLPADAVDLKAPAFAGGPVGGKATATSIDPKEAERQQTSFHGVTWGWSYEAALEKAKASGKPVLIDFTGVNCPNCRIMELEVFPREEVVQALGNFVTVQLYTDTVPIKSLDPDDRLKLADANLQREIRLFKDASNPNYVAIDPDGNVLDMLVGKNPPKRFVDFLNNSLGKYKSRSDTAKGNPVSGPEKQATTTYPNRAQREKFTFNGVNWGLSYDAALERARVERKPVLVFFTGINDVNSRIMDLDIFPKPDVAHALGRFIPVRLDTDIVPIDSLSPEQRSTLAEKNLDRQVKLLEDATTPALAILDGEGKLLARLGGKVQPETLVKFLESR